MFEVYSNVDISFLLKIMETHITFISKNVKLLVKRHYKRRLLVKRHYKWPKRFWIQHA